jgi:ribonuclease PH
VVATGSGRFVEVQGTAERGTFGRDDLGALTSLALGGIAELVRIQEKTLAEAGAR